MIYAAHQPNYLPWLGYFHKIASVDVFVILDDVQFEQGNYQNRVQIKSPQGPQWLTQPIRHNHLQRTGDVEFDARVNWREKHLKQIRSNYGRAASFQRVFPLLEQWLNEAQGEKLAAVNISLIEAVARAIGLTTKIVLSSSFNVTSPSAVRLVEIGTKLGALVYLSGHGARKYQSERDFRAAGIALRYTDFAAREYSQLWGEFAGGLSAIDALFNIGLDGTAKACMPPLGAEAVQ